jgi:hypothetical protein
MVFRRQHKHYPGRSHLSGYERRAHLGLSRNGPDPILFALATTLPMSCFPKDDVHPSARYGTAEPRLCRFDSVHSSNRSGNSLHTDGQMCLLSQFVAPGSNAVQPSEFGANSISCALDTNYTSCHGSNAISPYPRDQILHRCPIGNGDIFDTVPPLSASTASLDGSSNWSSSEPAPEFGAVPMDGFDPRYLDNSCQKGAPHEFLGDSVHVLCQDFPENDWNGWVTCRANAIPQPAPSVGMQKLACDLSLPHPLDCLKGGHFDVQSNTATYLSSTSKPPTPQPVLPTAEGDNALDQTLHHVDNNGVDNFLDELGSTIDWDNIEPCLEDRTIGQTNMVINLQSETSIDAASTIPNDQHHQSPDLPDYIDDSDDDSPNHSLGEEGTSFTDLADVLDEHEERTAAALLSSTGSLN